MNSRFDPRTFTRSHQKCSDTSFGSPIISKAPSYSSNSSNQLLQLNISDISLVDCTSPMVDLGKNDFHLVNSSKTAKIKIFGICQIVCCIKISTFR